MHERVECKSVYCCVLLVRQMTIDFVRRAENANFKALVVTVDTVLLGRRLTTERKEMRLSKLIISAKIFN